MTFTDYANAHYTYILSRETSGKQVPMDILEKLMKEAVTHCEAHSTDILYDFDSIREAVENKNSAMYADGFFWFMGFRDLGEDHLSFIECRWADGELDALRENYKSIYKVEMFPTEFDYVSWVLKRIDF